MMKIVGITIAVTMLFLSCSSGEHEKEANTPATPGLDSTSTAENQPVEYDTSIYGDILNDVDGTYKAEAARISKFKSRVKRDTAKLSVKLNDGRWYVFHNNNSDGEGYKRYFFRDYHSSNRIYSVSVTFWEGQATMLLPSDRDSAIEVLGPPIFSPSGNRFVTHFIGVPELNLNGFEIWKVNKGNIEKEFAIEELGGGDTGTPWYPMSAKWLSEKEIQIEKGKYDMEMRSVGTTTLVLESNKWREVK